VSSTFFKNCNLDTNTGLGGAIYLEISNVGEIELNEVIMEKCSAKNGGAIYSTLRLGAILFIKN
jgi:hypothetical protein